jgi:hypothetical protein
MLVSLYTYSFFKEASSASIKAHDGRFTLYLANLNDRLANITLVRNDIVRKIPALASIQAAVSLLS